MHLSTISALLGLAVQTATAACPYAGQAGANALKSRQPLPPHHHHARQSPATKGIFYMNRIGPSGSKLYISNADGTNATLLSNNDTAAFDIHASWSPDGDWIVFTSERRADGQADLYRVRPDGTGLETLVDTDSLEDSGTLSPDGSLLAYVSTQGNYTTNIWVKDVDTDKRWNVTDIPGVTRVHNPTSPQGHFRPAWSPDGAWIAFSSDRETDWTGHSNGTGWEHTQELSVYIVRPNGSDFRQVVSDAGMSYGTPQWSPDGKRLVYSGMTTEATYGAHGTTGQQQAVTSQIFSVDVETGTDIRQETTGPYLKVCPHYVLSENSSNIGYILKGTSDEGIAYTKNNTTHLPFSQTFLRNPSWSPDGSRVVYEVLTWDVRAAGKSLFSFDSDWDYRFMDVFPQFNVPTKRMAITQKQLGDSSVITSSGTYDDLEDVFDVEDVVAPDQESNIGFGLAGAFQPTFSPDGQQIAVGFGSWFTVRTSQPGTIYLANVSDPLANGTVSRSYTNLTETNGTTNAGFPSFSPDGTRLVYRLWNMANGQPLGLRVLDLTTGQTTNLTDGWDNTPGWSPDGDRIVFSRQVNWTAATDSSRWWDDRFDVMTIRPDGTDLKRLTDSPANDAHAVWSKVDGKTQILWNSGMYGFRDESALYDSTFQPYGQIMAMDPDGSNKRILTDTLWEDSMPLFIPNEYL